MIAILISICSLLIFYGLIRIEDAIKEMSKVRNDIPTIDDIQTLVNRCNRIERKADRALDENKIQDLKIDKLNN